MKGFREVDDRIINLSKTVALSNRNLLTDFEKEYDIKIPKLLGLILNKYGKIDFNKIMKFKTINKTKRTDQSGYRILGKLYLFDADNSIEEGFKTYSGRIGKNILPIADTPGGDIIYLNLNNEKIFLWDHECEGKKDNEFLVSNSFYDFILSLEVDDEVIGTEEKKVTMNVSNDFLKMIEEYKMKNPDSFVKKIKQHK